MVLKMVPLAKKKLLDGFWNIKNVIEYYSLELFSSSNKVHNNKIRKYMKLRWEFNSNGVWNKS